MATINNLLIKNYKEMEDHEGNCISTGCIYIGTKKICTWTDDFMGGAPRIYMQPEYSEIKLEKKIAELNKDKEMHGVRNDDSEYTIEYCLEFLIADLIKLKDDEKIFNKAVKKEDRMGVIIVSDGYHQFWYELPNKYSKNSKDEILREYLPFIEEAKVKQKFFKETEHNKHEIKIYTSKDDFKIGEPIKTKDIVKN